ncbi:Uncharacterized protein conserved in bacteria [Psychrobacter phenylpyruvicus]|uniref:Uncharacterized protein conserved in bacteria n=2 Tax=Psychrobacter phenylpyruvicus TaxID=29432 RepID=A0A379LPT4_9GAMM|nr:Uncharacterized protein conserved in bacteria [Psychrobacter phenylpyruvicus]
MLTRYRMASEGETAGEVWEPMALYYFNDSVREGVAEMIAALQAQNIETVILTGDPSEHAQTVAKELVLIKSTLAYHQVIKSTISKSYNSKVMW